MTAPTLAESWADELPDLPPDATAEQIAVWRRVFYRGALAAAGLPREQLQAELLGYARAIGTAAERAQA